MEAVGRDNSLGDLLSQSLQVSRKKSVSVGLRLGREEGIRMEGRLPAEPGQQGSLLWVFFQRRDGGRERTKESKAGPLGVAVPEGQLPSRSHTGQGPTRRRARESRLEQEVWSEELGPSGQGLTGLLRVTRTPGQLDHCWPLRHYPIWNVNVGAKWAQDPTGESSSLGVGGELAPRHPHGNLYLNQTERRLNQALC